MTSLRLAYSGETILAQFCESVVIDDKLDYWIRGDKDSPILKIIQQNLN
jgi:hypothetical protein